MPLFSRLICDYFKDRWMSEHGEIFLNAGMRAVLVAVFAGVNWMQFNKIKIKTE